MVNVRAGLFAVGSVTLFATVAACTGGGGGGGNGAAPCCAAQGQTEAPPAAFAPDAIGSAASAGRFAQPIAFLTSGAGATCVLPSGTGIQLPEFEDLGKPVEVEADGTYLVDIDREGAGRRVLVRVFDRDGDGVETDLGIAALASFPVAGEDAAPIPVSPIRFGAGGKMGESTLELALFCAMSKAGTTSGDDLQNLTFNDVRALMTSSFASAFSGVNDVGDALGFAKQYRHAVNGLVNLDTANRLALAELRESADALVDACRSPAPPAGLTCTSDGRAEFYRYWFLARRGDDADFSLPAALPRGLGDHLQALAQDMSDGLTDSFGGSPLGTGRAMELYKENHRLRVEIAAAAIERAASCFGDATDSDGDGVCEGGVVDLNAAIDTGRGPLSIRGALEQVRAAILAAPDELAIEAAWSASAEDIVQNFGIQSGLQPVPDVDDILDNVFFAARDGHQPAAQFAISTTASHLTIAQTLFDGAGGVRANIAGDIAMNLSGTPAADQGRVADLVFYATANGTDLTL